MMMRRSTTTLRAVTRRLPPAAAPRPFSPITPAHSHPPPPPPPARAFSSSPPLLKKRSADSSSTSGSSSSPASRKHAAAAAAAAAQAAPGSAAGAPDPENPLDMSALTAAYAAADAHFRAEIQQVLHGGRFNPDSLGAVPVPLKHSASPPSNSSSSSHSSSSSSAAPPTETFHLRELAQIVPRPGRTISLLVNDRRYIKDIMSAIQKSPDFNQQPQRSADNELELLLRVELERKDDLARRVRDACRAWRERVRQARTRHEKTLQDWKKAKLVLPDVIRKAEREMQKVQDKKMKEVDQEEAQALKQLDRQ